MENEGRREWIDKNAMDIRLKLSGGNLYGQPIDINNKHDCIVGAYVLGQTESNKLGYVSTPKPPAPKPQEAFPRPQPRPGQPNMYNQSDERLIWLVVGMMLTVIGGMSALVAYGVLIYAIR